MAMSSQEIEGLLISRPLVEYLPRSGLLTVIAGFFIIAGLAVIQRWCRPFREPFFRQPRGVAPAPHIEKAILENYERLKNTFYRVEQPHTNVLIIPLKFVDELKAHPHATFKQEGDARFLPQYTYMGTLDGSANEAIIPAIKDIFTKHLGTIVEVMRNEVAIAMKIHIGTPDEWTPVLPVQTMVQVVAQVAGAYGVGPDLARTPDFLECSVMFTSNCFNGAAALLRYPRWLRPLMQYVTPEISRCHDSYIKMKRIIKPVIEERMQLIAESKPQPQDLLTLVIENSPPHLRVNIDFQARNQLIIGMASTHTTAMTITNALFDLAARPEYLEPLRQEVLTMIAEESSASQFTNRGLMKLRKLDSFLKESVRFNPLNTTAFVRGLSEKITLSDGTILPRGTHIAAAAKPLALDSEYYDKPKTFDGFRFSRLREMPGNENRFQFVSAVPEAMHFGYGIHACPGRHVADLQIKIIIANILLNYDIRLRDGQARPVNQVRANGPHPDLDIPILFRSRKAM